MNQYMSTFAKFAFIVSGFIISHTKVKPPVQIPDRSGRGGYIHVWLNLVNRNMCNVAVGLQMAVLLHQIEMHVTDFHSFVQVN